MEPAIASYLFCDATSRRVNQYQVSMLEKLQLNSRETAVAWPRGIENRQ